ncbi:CbtB-domain containing protein [Cupriavidus pauculus]|uniref:CbtB domain-containing protein n=1 Tax=Cupriavidus pauculus TaxID=82633 RepID=UPI001EE2E53A|nr:CbtB-domain containing protein [Cupriavidus pauculus]GJG93064.1 CbtB-domain containing protein [Cupriavidus pauculus]
MHASAIHAPAANPVAIAPVSIPVRELLPWAIFGGMLLLLAIYFVGVEEGATAMFNTMLVHEFVHDGRHLLGFPCH